jgi:acetyl esterase/lipase
VADSPIQGLPRQDWRKLGKTELDGAYNNAAAVPGSAAIVAGWTERSAALRARYPRALDRPYGPRERNRIDLLEAAENAPLLVFVHGGYWQMRAKENFTFIAKGPLEHGVSVALVGYTLAPEATLDEMAEEIHAALDVLAPRGPLILSGWSAGGHLAAMCLDHPAVKGGIAVSGIYDLEPIRHSYVNDKLGLDEAAAHRNSPIHRPLSDKRLDLAAGDAELPLMIGQTEEFAAMRRSQPGELLLVPGGDHFTVLEELAKPDGQLAELVYCQIAALHR